MKGIDKFLRKLTTLFVCISVITLLAIVVVVVIDVFLRYVLGQTLRGAYEMVQYLLMISIFSSFAYCQTERGHVHVTMLTSLFPQKLRLILYALTELICCLGAFAVAYASIRQGGIYLSSNMITGVLLLPLWPFYMLEGLCMAVFGIALLWEAIKGVIAVSNQEVAEEIQSSWT